MDTMPDLNSLPIEKQFEIVLEAFLNKKRAAGVSDNDIRALRSQNLKKFRETGAIPPVLLGIETRGRKTTLPLEIQNRFVELIKSCADETSQYFLPLANRTVTYLQAILEDEFKQKIHCGNLYTFLRTKSDLKALLNGSVKAGV